MLVQLLLLVFCQTILAGRVSKPYYDTNNYEAMGRHFEEYIKTHNKQYDETEKAQRFVYFIANVKQINENNGLYETLFDINHFTDWSEEEKHSIFGFNKSPNDRENVNSKCKVQGDPKTNDAPEAYDWRDQGAVSPAKDQSQCGSCWAFSATAVVESKLLLQNKRMNLSEQQLVDCDKTSFGCFGGFPTLAFTYLMESGGQMTENDYPYEATNSTCQFNASKVAARVLNCTEYNLTNEGALKELLFKEGPLAITISDDPSWADYHGGIWDKCNQGKPGHAVLLVGYGSENGQDFWTIKNSYGPKFGENGFMRLKRGVNCCSIGGTGTNQPSAVSTASIA